MPGPIRSPLAEYHDSQGAQLGEYHGAVLPARFSDSAAEHTAVRKASGLFDFSFRVKFVMKGPDRVRFLHRIVSNDIKKLTPGQGTYATLLDAHGHILSDFRVFCAEVSLLIDTDADLRDKTMAALGRYVIGDKVQMEPLEIFALAFQGPRSRGLLEKTLHIDLPAMNEYDHFATNFAGFPVRVARATSTGEEGYEVWVGAKGIMGVWGAACGQAPTYDTLPCGYDALESLRIEAGIPRYGPDLAEDTLPLEAGLLNALSFTKGCYVGQEIVERARSRGHVNWKLVGLFVDSPVPPPTGEKLLSEGKAIGEISSACVSPTLSKTIALAYVRREVSDPGQKLNLASGASAEVSELPFYHPASSGSRRSMVNG